MANNKLAIIGGSGLYDIEDFKDREFIKIDTPWGNPSDDILKTKYNNKEIYFLPSNPYSLNYLIHLNQKD